MSQNLGTLERPLQVAIVGAGPSGFYAAEALLKQANIVCRIDFFNRFPTPFGLIREGVAPDHQSIKSVTRIYDRIASNPNVRYFGNVTFGVDINRDDLQQFYDQIIYAVGAQADRRMGIAGENLHGSLSATAFVGWYNGHPDYRDLDVDLSHHRAVVIGNGNVAMDIARIVSTPIETLAKTDIADYAIEQLRESQIREVVVLGRRGPVQAAFTYPELKELGELDDVDVIVDPADLELDEHSAAVLAIDKTAQKNYQILREFAAAAPSGASQRIYLRFLVSPKAIIGDNDRVTAVETEHNSLVVDKNGGLRPQGTGSFETIETGLILRSVGYRTVPLKGVPFDQRTNTISNVLGRVTDLKSGDAFPGEYVVGWAKRGPSGVIGTNKPDSAATVNAMIEDLSNLPGIPDPNRDPERIVALLRQRKPDFVTYDDWRSLDQYELARGAEQGRPRVKVTSVSEMLNVIRRNKANES